MTRWRLVVAEALLLLAIARVMVAGLRFGWWRRLLGPIAAAAACGSGSNADRLLAKAVERAALRLPGGAKCLPRAIALYWMLGRRNRPAQLVIAVLPGADRGQTDDLHAWVESGAEILLGELHQPFHPLVRFGNAEKH